MFSTEKQRWSYTTFSLSINGKLDTPTNGITMYTSGRDTTRLSRLLTTGLLLTRELLTNISFTTEDIITNISGTEDHATLIRSERSDSIIL